MTTSSPAEQLVGAVLNGRWRLVRLLGEGGMGAVYEADGLRGEGKRAIKLLHPEFSKEEQILQRFFAEAQANQALQHPNVAQIYEAARAEDGTPYLVMELLQGTPLTSWLEHGQPVPPEHVVPVMQGVLQALGVAHTRRIVHRDLKPDNLFLMQGAQGPNAVKVLDFGIAKLMDVAGGMGQKTRTGVLLGTPGYMSPEQIKNAKGVDPRSDLWSLGVIMYELLTMHEPFPADNEFARLTAVLTEEVTPIEKVMPQLAAWGPFMRRALAKDLNQRFQSAEEMMQAMLATMRGAAMQGNAANMAYAETQKPPPGLLTQTLPQDGSYVPAAPSYAQPAAYSQQAATNVSAFKPMGTPTVSSHHPNVAVVDATPFHLQNVPLWVAGVVGLVCLGLGFAIGVLVGG